MGIWEQLGLDMARRRMVALVGAGGKTSTLYALARQAADSGRTVVVTTTTHILRHPGLPLRINTNGLSDLIWQKPTAPMLEGLIDTVSVSLNATDPEEYLRLTRSKFGPGSYEAMLNFTRACTQYVPHVVMTVVGEPVTTPEEQEKARQICEGLGATLRVRPYES